MCNQEQLIGYLYDDLSAPERAVFEAHLAGCAACRREVGDLRQTRQHLTSWAPPAPPLDFRVIQGTAARRPLAFIPTWALSAAAALLLVAGAAAIANLEVGRTADGFVVRTGWGRTASAPASSVSSAPAPSVPSSAPPSAAAPVPAAAAAAASDPMSGELALLRRRLEEIEAAQAQQIGRTAGAVKPGITTAELRQILAASEARQREEMALQIKQVWMDFSAVRANDLARVQQTLGQAQNLTNYQLRQQRSSIDEYLRTVSQVR